MQITTRIRTKFATLHARKAVELARAGRFDAALTSAQQASQLDPTLPHPHAVAAKVHFWRGELQLAEQRLAEAARRGLAPIQLDAMRGAIEEFRIRAQMRRDAATSSAAAWKSRAQSVATAWRTVTGSFDERRLTMILFVLALLAILAVAPLP